MYQIVIADDEPIILEGICNFIDWTALGCEIAFTASNGKDALEFLQVSHADIFITDIRMPGLSGLEVIRQISGRSIPCKTIIISGYSDFHYAQEALQLGVTDFILKDNPLEQIEKAVKKAIEEIEKEQARLTDLRSKFFYDLLHGTILPESKVQEKVKLLCEDLHGYYCTIAHVTSTRSKYTGTEENAQKLLYSLSNFLSMSLHPYVYSSFATKLQDPPLTAHSMQLEKSNFLCLVLTGDGLNEETLTEKCNQIFQLSEQIIQHLTLKIGISQYHQTPGTFFHAYKEALTAIHLLKPREQFKFYHISPLSTQTNEAVLNAIEYIQTHYMEDLSLNTVAMHVGLNASYLSRIFKKETTKSLTEYITSYRIEQSKELLLSKSYKLFQIAEKTGFHDTAYFSNTFKKVTGYSPTEYKILYGNND